MRGTKGMSGLRTVFEALKLESYPMNKHDVDYTVGDIAIEDGHGGLIEVRELTDQISQSEFASAEEVIDSLKRSLADRRRAS